MSLSKEIRHFFWKELLIEWRERYAINGFLLYVVATVFLVYLSFTRIDPITWNTLYWIIILFTAINAVAKSFMQEKRGQLLYYYTLISAPAILFSKIIYNTVLLLFLAFVGLLFYSVVVGNPVQNQGLFMVTILLGSIGFSFTLTLVSAIASKANNKATLMAILSFPVILPILLLVVQLSKRAIEQKGWSGCGEDLLTLTAINLIVASVGYLLFPYLWRE